MGFADRSVKFTDKSLKKSGISISNNKFSFDDETEENNPYNKSDT